MRAALAFLALLLSFPLRADQLDDAIEREMARRHVPGLALLVLQHGKIVRERSYGLANVEHGVPVTPRTLFQSGSVGKTFTAALILLLAEDGKLRLDDPVSRHLPESPPAWSGITIRHLLTHTSGLGDPYQKIDLRKDYSDAELIALEATLPLQFAPGERFSYSNAGYHLLGFIATRVGGKHWAEQLRERVFAPLGMDARLISEADIVPHRAAGYEWADGKLRNQSWVAPSLNATADGALYLTARDLALWDTALRGERILNERLRTASWTPPRLRDGSTSPYGYGWYVGEQNGHRTVLHGGAWQGFKALMTRYVDDGLTVIVLANSAATRVGKIGDLAASHFIPALAPVRARAIEDREPALAAQAREALARLAARQAPAGLSAQEAERFTPRWIGIVADEIAGAGPLRGVELLERSSDGAAQTSRYRFLYRDETLLVTVKRTRDGTIERLDIGLE
jgi:CubicO group peptidase (beta-lactamase class C family)